jgi:hypothetical protein
MALSLRPLARGCARAAAATVLAGGLLLLGHPGAVGAPPVEGGGSFTDAPILEPGAYSDTIRMREKLFYAVDLQAGERLRFELRAKGERTGPSEPTGTLLLNVYNPVRAEYVINKVKSFTGANKATIKMRGPRVGSTKGLDDFWAQPGTYYVSVRFYKLLAPNERSPVFRREYPTRIDVDITGQAVASPSPTPTAASPAPTDAATDASDDSEQAAPPAPPAEGDSYPSFLSVAVLAFLVGAVGSFLLTAGRALVRSRA